MSGENIEHLEISQDYESLTNNRLKIKEKWTISLLLCAVSVSIACFLFGYNIGTLSIMKPFIMKFYETNYFPDYLREKAENDLVKPFIDNLVDNYEKKETNYTVINNIFLDEEFLYLSREKETREKFNITDSPIFPRAKKKIDLKRQQLNELRLQLDLYKISIEPNLTKFNQTKNKLHNEKKLIDKTLDLIWNLTVIIFMIGFCIGAAVSKFIADEIGRKHGLLFHYIISLFSSLFIFILQFINFQYISSYFIKLNAFTNGFQGGIGFSLTFLYLNEISPIRVRGEVGMIGPIVFVIGILISQILGFDFLFGNEYSWQIPFCLPVVIALIGIILLLCFPESPKTLILERNNILEANKALKLLRKTRSVSSYINEILEERDSNSRILLESVLVTPYIKQLKKCWFFSFMLHVSVQSSGIYPVIYYAKELFEDIGLIKNSLQYVDFILGVTCLFTLIVTTLLLDRIIGRKLLLILSIISIIFDLVSFNIFMTLRETDPLFNYACLVCILIFIICFSFGIGPIPFIYICECFKHESRSSAIAFSVFTNGICALIIFVIFQSTKNVVGYHMFTGVLFILTLTLIFSLFRMPETRNRSIKEIKSKFQELSVYRF